MAVAAAVRRRDRTRTAVDASVRVGVCVEVQIISEEHIADPMPQVVTGTVVEQIVDVPALQLQEGLAEEIVDSTVPLIKEEIVEVIQPLPQDYTQGRLAVAYQRAHREACHRSTQKSWRCLGLRSTSTSTM